MLAEVASEDERCVTDPVLVAQPRRRRRCRARALRLGASGRSVIETFTIALGNGIDLSCRAAGRRRRVRFSCSCTAFPRRRSSGTRCSSTSRRSLPLRRAEPARLRAVVGAARRRGVSRQAPDRRHLVAHRFARRRARRAGRARLGRRARLGPGGAAARGDPAARHHQLAAPGHVPARAARQPGAAGGERVHELPVPPRRGSAAERERLRAPVAVLHQHGRRRSGTRRRRLVDRRSARSVSRRLDGGTARRAATTTGLRRCGRRSAPTTR